MSWDINRVILIGRLSNDPELKYITSGSAVVKFGLAVGGKPKPDKSDSVSFFNIVAWGKTAENIAHYCKKGNQIGIDGRLDQRTWKTQEGQSRSMVEIIADRVEFLQAAKGNQKTEQPFYSDGKEAPPMDEDYSEQESFPGWPE